MPLRLKMTMREYDRTLPLLDRRIEIEGVDPMFAQFDIRNFELMLNSLEFDVTEMSMSSYLIAKENGLPIIAIPVFPHRRFRHSYIFVNRDSKIREPRDLIGKRVGIPEYQLTALLWIRGMLAHEYDVRPEQIKWFADNEKDRYPIRLPPGLSLQRIPAGTSEQLFLNDGLDSLMHAEIPKIFQQGNPKIKRLFEDFVAVEGEYYRKTHLFPIMHTVVLKASLHEEHQWLAPSLWKAFVEAKELSYRRLKDPRISNFVWSLAYGEHEESLFGPDVWRYNLRDNREVLETLIRYSKEQGLISREPKLEELFAPNTLHLHEGTG